MPDFELDYEMIQKLKNEANDKARAEAHVVDGDVIETETPAEGS